MYIYRDDFTIEGANFSKPFEKERKPFKMEVKIVSIDLIDKSGVHIILKCLNNLGVTGFLPPPGGAHEAINTQSDTSINKNFLRS